MKTNDEIIIEKYRIKPGVRSTHHGLTGDKIKELHAMGFRASEIKKIIGCSKSTISYHIGKRRIKKL